MILRIGCLAAALLVLAARAAVAAENVELDGIRVDYKACRTIVEAPRRLACYDGLYTKLEPPSFKGSHTEETPSFRIERPTLLRYQSDGPIFVMYLLNDKGVVVQNLHIGGGGESQFLIQKTGIYSLQVSATDTWRVWLEPVDPRG